MDLMQVVSNNSAGDWEAVKAYLGTARGHRLGSQQHPQLAHSVDETGSGDN